RRFIRRGPRGSALFHQPSDAKCQKPLPPFVARVATNAVAGAQLGHRPLPAREVLPKVMPLEHGIGLQPGHRRISEWDSEKCHPCPRTPVNHVPRLYPALPNTALLL